MTDSMLESALAYAEKGYKVFPCCWPDENGKCACGNKGKSHQAGKSPVYKKGLMEHGLTEATSDPEQIRKWWTRWPNANIGMATAGRVVADFDKGKSGKEGRSALEAEYGKLPSTLTHRTGGGGLHYIYDNLTDEKVISVNGLRDGVDRKADGGYIIMPPSLHPSQNRYEALNEEQIAPSPEWLMKLEKPSEKGAIKALDGVPEGERDIGLYKYACRLFGKGLTRDEVEPLVALAGSRCDPSFSEEDCLRKVKSASKYEKTESIEPPPLINLEDVESEEVDWLWYPYIPSGKFTLMDGDPGECKSWLALAIASRVSLGELGREPANVIIASLEDDVKDAIKPRLEALGADMERIRIIDMNFPFTLDDRGLKAIEGYIKEMHAELLILDPILGYMAGADIYRPNDTRAITSQLRRIAGENKCAILGIRHMTKPGKGLPTKAIYKGLGSIDIIAAARSGLLVGHMEDEDGNMTERGMAHIKSNYAPLGDSIGFEILNFGRQGVFSWNISCTVTSRGMLGISKKGTKADEAKIWLRDKLANGEPRSSREIYADAAKEGISEGTLDNAKRALGIKSMKEGKEWFWSLPGEAQVEREGGVV